MKTTILFMIPIPLITTGFVIGGRDGGIISIIGCVALLAISFWQVIKIGKQMNGPAKSNPVPKEKRENSH